MNELKQRLVGSDRNNVFSGATCLPQSTMQIQIGVLVHSGPHHLVENELVLAMI
jgi:hypothetical protein